MSELRDKVVEAMATVIAGHEPDYAEHIASAALDAALDVLGEHQEEWVFVADDEPYLRSFVDALLGVLRAGKGSEG